MDYFQLINYTWLVINFVGAVAIAIRFILKGKGADDNDTIQKYKDALEIRNTEIDDLKDQLAKLTEKIAEMSTAIIELQAKNTTLESLKGGEKYFIQLSESVKQFHEFAIIATEDHKKMLLTLNDIKNTLSITKRNAD